MSASSSTGTDQKQLPPAVTNRDLLIPYFAPYFAYVAMDFFFGGRLPVEVVYTLRLIVVSALLLWARRWYAPLRGPNNPVASVLWGIAVGIIGCAVWLLLLWPFVDPFGGEKWQLSGFFLRLTAASLIVPVFEELFIRGYVLMVALQWDQARRSQVAQPLATALDQRCLSDETPGSWSLWAVIISTIAFALGHHVYEWPATLFYSALMVGLWIIRKDLLSCVVAHGVTNFVLALYVKTTGQWGFW